MCDMNATAIPLATNQAKVIVWVPAVVSFMTCEMVWHERKSCGGDLTYMCFYKTYEEAHEIALKQLANMRETTHKGC